MPSLFRQGRGAPQQQPRSFEGDGGPGRTHTSSGCSVSRCFSAPDPQGYQQLYQQTARSLLRWPSASPPLFCVPIFADAMRHRISRLAPMRKSRAWRRERENNSGLFQCTKLLEECARAIPDLVIGIPERRRPPRKLSPMHLSAASSAGRASLHLGADLKLGKILGYIGGRFWVPRPPRVPPGRRYPRPQDGRVGWCAVSAGAALSALS